MTNESAHPIEVPPGISVENNVAEAKAYLAGHSPDQALLWFYNQVRNHGPWDFKQRGSQYEGFGNWHYGVVGTAMGIPEQVLLRMAGYAQMRAGTSKDDWSTPLKTAPYGDDPRDQEAIQAGIEWARVNRLQGIPFLANGPIHIPMPLSDAGWGAIHPQGINPAVHEAFQDALAWRPPYRDPLAIDLDGDGIETVGIGSAPVLFDHDGDGVRSPTGWLQPDDAWLVMDRDADTQIQTGAELFGVDTVKRNGQHAQSGFDALREIDSNGDGVLDAQDTDFSYVQVWQDRNQDGVSQAEELASLADHGVSRIELQSSPVGLDLGNGNHIASAALAMFGDGRITQAVDLMLAAGAESVATDAPTPQTSQAQPEPQPLSLANTDAWERLGLMDEARPKPSVNALWCMAFEPAVSPSAWAVSDEVARLNAQANLLIEAMAAFSPPAPGLITGAADERTLWTPLLAVPAS